MIKKERKRPHFRLRNNTNRTEDKLGLCDKLRVKELEHRPINSVR